MTLARSPSWPQEACGGKLVLLLEGGYDLAALARVGARLAGGAHRPSRRLPPRRRDRPGAGGGGDARRAPGRRAGRLPDVTMRSPSLAAVDLRRRGRRSGRSASRLLALDRSRGLAVAGQPGARPPRQPRSLAGRRAHGRRARRRAGRPLRSADAVLAAFIRDGAARRWALLGAALAVAALFGWHPRLCFALSTALYLSYATVGRDFLSFQWDNLLLECGLLAAFLRRPTRPAPLGALPLPAGAVQALLRVGPRQVAVAISATGRTAAR